MTDFALTTYRKILSVIGYQSKSLTTLTNLKHIWNSIVCIGIDYNQSVIEKKRIRLLNSISIIGSLLYSLYFVKFFVINAPLAWLPSLIISILLLMPIYLNSRNQHYAAKIVFSTIPPIITFTALLWGKGVGIEYLIFFCSVSPIFFFDKIKTIAAFWVLSILCFFLVRWSYNIFQPLYSHPSWQISFYINLFTIFVLLVAITFNFKSEIEEYTNIVQKKSNTITDSIKYASQIQTAMLPPLETISETFPEHFVLYKPKDIVSGDFYWSKKIGLKHVIIAADCSGHGVPGAFMSMLGISLLNEIVNEYSILKPSEILETMRLRIKASLHQTGRKEDNRDGMDMAICIIDKERYELQFAGANMPLFLIRDNNLAQVSGDRNPISVHKKERPFTNKSIRIKRGDSIYIFSDGYIDQIGGPDRKKFLKKNFKKFLVNINDRSMNRQRDLLEDRIANWQNGYEQIDDMMVIGLKI